MSPSLPALHGRYCLISNHSLWAAAVWNGRRVLLCFIYPSFFFPCSCSGVGCGLSYPQSKQGSVWDALIQDHFSHVTTAAPCPDVLLVAFRVRSSTQLCNRCPTKWSTREVRAKSHRELLSDIALSTRMPLLFTNAFGCLSVDNSCVVSFKHALLTAITFYRSSGNIQQHLYNLVSLVLLMTITEVTAWGEKRVLHPFHR